MKYDCGHEAPEPSEVPAIVTAGGWCAPSGVLYDEPRIEMCPDCSARMTCIMTIGIDPGSNGSYLTVPRGGIQYGTPE